MPYKAVSPYANYLRQTIALLATAAAAAAGAQTSSSNGWATITGSWTVGADVVITPLAGSFTWAQVLGSGTVVNLNSNTTDNSSYITSTNFSQITGSAWDYSGAEQIIYWYAYNGGASTETVDWKFTLDAFAQTNITAGYGVQNSFGVVYDDYVPGDLMFDVAGAGYGSGSQSISDSIGYTSTIAPGQYDLLVGLTLSRSVLDYNTQAPSPAAAIPFGIGLLGAVRRRRAAR